MSDFQTLGIDVLQFDKQNPRLPTSLENANDKKIIRYLARKTGIENLMASIGENDFFPGEAIVVVRLGAEKYTVIEGNRRLAALRLLQDPELAGNMPRIRVASQQAKYKPTEAPAYIADSREDTLQYLGFRHISGVQRWDPLAKARYLKSLFDNTENTEEDTDERYRSVAREIGSNILAVRRSLDALAAYQVIESKEFYGIEDMSEETFKFGTFYTATGNNVEIANFVGIRRDDAPTHPILNPSAIDSGNLEELTRYMFERDVDGNTRLGDSRNIRKLGAILSAPAALEGIRDGKSLETAYRLTPKFGEEFVIRMNQAIEELKQANANIHAVERDDQSARAVVEEALKIIKVQADRFGIPVQ